MSQAAFLGAYLGLVVLGAAAAFHPAVRGLGLGARLAVAFGAGALGLSVEGIVFSWLGVPWSRLSLLVPLLLATVVLAFLWRRQGRAGGARDAQATGPRATPWVVWPCVLLAAAGLTHLGLSLLTARTTSADYLFFWGVKAARFAQAAGIDVDFLGWKYAIHTHTTYPPLVPISSAWAALWGGKMHWRVGLLATFPWFLASVAVVPEFLRRRLSVDQASVVTSFWTAALAISLVTSLSGGNAEAPLIFFLTLAGVALLVEPPGEPAPSRFVPALALAGAALTKNEGLVGAGLLVLGVLMRDLRWQAPGRLGRVRRILPLALAPALAFGLWYVFEWAHGLPLSDPIRETAFHLQWGNLGVILSSSPQHLAAGTWGLSWWIPLVFLLIAFRRWSTALPGLVLAGGLLLFTFFYYLHVVSQPAKMIEWTLPRLCQPSLSLLILSAGLAFFTRARGAEERDPRTGQETGPSQLAAESQVVHS